MPSPSTRPRGPVARRLRWLAWVGLGALTLVTALGFAGAWWWVLDLLAHFRVFVLMAAILAALALAALRWWRLALWALAIAVTSGALVVPLYLGAPTDSAPVTERLRVISYNVLSGNPRTPEAARHVASLDPDVVALIEVSEAQIQAFEAALPGYHRIGGPRDDPFGLAVLTRLPPTHARMLALGASWVPAISLELPLGPDHALAFLALHPPPPVSAELSHTRDAVLRAASQWAADQTGPAIVVGDLNATPWSAPLRKLLDEGPLRSTHHFGLDATWPSWLGPFGLPIDHALVSGPIQPVDRHVEPSFGSDHRMLVVDLALRPSAG